MATPFRLQLAGAAISAVLVAGPACVDITGFARFVEREEHPEDRRTKRVRLAEKGERFLDNLERLRSRILNRALDRLSRQERDHVLRGFALMVRAMKATAE